MEHRKDLFIWTVYDHPKDYPNDFVVRVWNYDKPTKIVHTGKTLEDARRHIPDGLIKLDRLPQDDPCIVEVWL